VLSIERQTWDGALCFNQTETLLDALNPRIEAIQAMLDAEEVFTQMGKIRAQRGKLRLDRAQALGESGGPGDRSH
jgi:hypothetical protein